MALAIIAATRQSWQMIKRQFRTVLIAALLAAPLHAQPAGDEIVVTAPSKDPGELRRQVSTFTRTVSDISEGGQFARRNRPFCPAIIGLDPAYHDLVLGRIRQAAAATGVAQEAKPGCKVNLAVIFTPDGDALLKALESERRALFSSQSSDKIKELFQPGKPLRWWYGTNLAGSDGMPVAEGQLRRATASLISTGVRIDLSTTVMIVDVTRAEGYPLDSLASFIGMISFAQIRGDTSSLASAPSILSLFAHPGPRGKALRDLTVWDRAYLYGLYHSPVDRPAWQQRPRLTKAIMHAIGEGN